MNRQARTPERIRHHYEVEKELAARLRNSTREERTALFRTLYDELFARVPDHPRLARRETEESSRRAVAARMALLQRHLHGVKRFLEFAPGDCRLAYEVCRHVEKVYGVDISDQAGNATRPPDNFELIVYDGYNVDLPSASMDLAFSYQFIEHLHPDDVQLHFETVKRLLKPGGCYVFSTPHRFSGPHDVSAHFSETPEGFHFKEWTYGEMADLLRTLGFSGWCGYRFGRPRPGAFWNAATLALEDMIGALPRRLCKKASRRLFHSVTVIARV